MNRTGLRYCTGKCLRGHQLTNLNLMKVGGGRTRCRICRLDIAARARAKARDGAGRDPRPTGRPQATGMNP